MKKILFIQTIVVLSIFMTMFVGCSNDGVSPDDEITGTDTVTVMWGPHTSQKQTLAELKEFDADRNVGTIILKSSEESYQGGFSIDEIMTLQIDVMIKACSNPRKLVHRGKIVRPGMNTSTLEEYKSQQADSAKICEMGYTIVNPVYGPHAPSYFDKH